jgi:hypothetical protein
MEKRIYKNSSLASAKMVLEKKASSKNTTGRFGK